MMSQIGSGGAPPARRSASPAATVFAQFMSAMLTYFDFMLQKQGYERKDRTETALFSSKTAIGPVRTHSYRVLPPDAKYWNRREKCAITAANAAA
jgi:hypothetical protein